VKSTPNQSSSSRKRQTTSASKGSNQSSNEFPSANDSYLLNMYLQKGTYPVFLEMADNFFSIIQTQLLNQDK
tara:strand:- start:287 stop:502 length:216 start_codon:yes stop_codon:yes gene_type:complete